MDRETLNTAYAEIPDFKDKLGEAFFDAIMEEDNTSYEMAKGIINVFSECNTQRDFELANHMLMAICGYSFESLTEKIKKLDADGYQWESV